MVRFEVQLMPQASGRWAARLADGSMLATEIRQRSEVAELLLRQGADPRSQLVVRVGTEIIAFDSLDAAAGTQVVCSDAGMVEKD